MIINVTSVKNDTSHYDNYFVELRTGLSIKQYTIVVDFVEKFITGDVIAYGDWFDIDLDECLHVLNLVKEQDRLVSDYNHLLNHIQKGD